MIWGSYKSTSRSKAISSILYFSMPIVFNPAGIDGGYCISKNRSAPCGNGGYAWDDLYPFLCSRLHDKRVPWNAARATCLAEKADLAPLYYTNQALAFDDVLAKSASLYWIALNDIAVEGTWTYNTDIGQTNFGSTTSMPQVSPTTAWTTAPTPSYVRNLPGRDAWSRRTATFTGRLGRPQAASGRRLVFPRHWPRRHARPVRAPVFTKWMPGRPVSGDQARSNDCATFKVGPSGAYFLDADCDERLNYICQIPAKGKKCPLGYQRIGSPLNQCYAVFYAEVRWKLAREYCRDERNATLLTVENHEKMDTVTKYLQRIDSAWIGLRQIIYKGSTRRG
ncbi:hypothetical protein EGW08_011977 [Elysia chlorotica]|uniref:C-type lectin domain-containing protein n=1 Tax=Elysia chlorotica TaxID=188477 RepID=A0A3S1B5B4_ELYCH|nr:hypothetical protein EGW08_011977 [Elysia chlorotica]